MFIVSPYSFAMRRRCRPLGVFDLFWKDQLERWERLLNKECQQASGSEITLMGRINQLSQRNWAGINLEAFRQEMPELEVQKEEELQFAKELLRTAADICGNNYRRAATRAGRCLTDIRPSNVLLCGYGLLLFSVAQERAGNITEAVSSCAKAAESFDNAGHLEGIVAAEILQGILKEKLNDTEGALAIYKGILETSMVSPNGYYFGAVNNNLAVVMEKQQRLDEASDCNARLTRIGPYWAETIHAARSFSNHGIVYEMKGDLAKAISITERSLATDSKNGYKEGEAKSRVRLASLLVRSYYERKDLRECQKAWDYIEGIAEFLKTSNNKTFCATAFRVAAIAKGELGDNDDAQSFFEMAEKEAAGVHGWKWKQELFSTEMEMRMAATDLAGGRLERAAQRYGRLINAECLKGRSQIKAYYDGMRHFCDGIVAIDTGSLAAADRALLMAQRRYSEVHEFLKVRERKGLEGKVVNYWLTLAEVHLSESCALREEKRAAWPLACKYWNDSVTALEKSKLYCTSGDDDGRYLRRLGSYMLARLARARGKEFRAKGDIAGTKENYEIAKNCLLEAARISQKQGVRPGRLLAYGALFEAELCQHTGNQAQAQNILETLKSKMNTVDDKLFRQLVKSACESNAVDKLWMLSVGGEGTLPGGLYAGESLLFLDEILGSSDKLTVHAPEEVAWQGKHGTFKVVLDTSGVGSALRLPIIARLYWGEDVLGSGRFQVEPGRTQEWKLGVFYQEKGEKQLRADILLDTAASEVRLLTKELGLWRVRSQSSPRTTLGEAIGRWHSALAIVATYLGLISGLVVFGQSSIYLISGFVSLIMGTTIIAYWRWRRKNRAFGPAVGAAQPVGQEKELAAKGRNGAKRVSDLE